MAAIFITGGTGFIGSALVKKLVSQKLKIHLIIRPSSSIEKIKDCEKKCIFHSVDLIEKEKLSSIVKKINPDITFHLAAAGVFYGLDSDQKIFDTNVWGAQSLMNSLEGTKCKKIINTGTCFEYDGKESSPYSEEVQQRPQNWYGISKMTANRVIAMYADRMMINSITLRPFNIYGIGEDETRLISSIIHACLTGKQLRLTSGDQVRDYLYLDDLIEAYELCIKYVPKKINSEFNIGSGNAISLKKLGETIALLCNADSSLLQFGALPYRKNEMMYLVSQPSRAKKELKWEVKNDLKTGIKKLIASLC